MSSLGMRDCAICHDELKRIPHRMGGDPDILSGIQRTAFWLW